MTRLYIAGEDISAEESVILGFNNKLYPAGGHAGEYVGDAKENIREGFRCAVEDNGDIREDDA